MPVAVVFLLRAVVLILLWGFVIATVVAVRHDVFGTKSRRAAPTAPVSSVAPRPAAASTPSVAEPPSRRAARKAQAAQTAPVLARRLIVVDGPFAGASVALSSLPVTIGRSPESSIVINDDYVSHHHAQLAPRGQEWLISDAGSTNGTFVGDVKVTAPVVVPVGGRIRIGHNVLELQA